jgi:hypothetical protein
MYARGAAVAVLRTEEQRAHAAHALLEHERSFAALLRTLADAFAGPLLVAARQGVLRATAVDTVFAPLAALRSLHDTLLQALEVRLAVGRWHRHENALMLHS